ncbi:Innexin-19 [Caenorhabditis elegans]|uniref:Innexin-19 n=2 Tax=Caenorhabditis elegans TaxID=6239 RepID=INX19_CAEEL|nr:Innexin-19 [Caenorhabditis elegans]O61715.2 RecName: Full=Innexin-19; AltName: Full=Neuronal symmetry protein 5; AltName: Full=Protein opu-19 [Caenorhabditis elegans]CCD69899.1 Innexin-19 [Caenorhabditis elegans]|eukprot:NP_490983.2 Innexin-19 [Caenorhabditis elegans]
MWRTPASTGPLRQDRQMFFHATLARSFINALSVRGDDDAVDRLNYYYTPLILAVCCLVISAKQYGGTPIECWVNPHSRESMEEYIESYCWIQNTYWIPMYENVPDDHTAREEKQIGYYQWVPFILIAEALMFSLPCIFWRLCSFQSGLNIQTLINAACDGQALLDASDRQKAVEAITTNFVDNLDLQSPNGRIRARGWIARIKFSRFLSGQCLSILHSFTKLLYSMNVVAQFLILNACLKSSDFLFFGFQVLNDIWAGRPWTETGHFPRVTLCDFEVRYLANLNRYTVQCALLINIINEKVFAFLWCWYMILAIITTCSFIYWIANSFIHSEKVDYVMKFIQIAESSEFKKLQKFEKDATVERLYTVIAFAPHLLDTFVSDFLKSDGVLMLRMISNHAGDMIVVQLVRNLWQEFRERNWREFEEHEEMKDVEMRRIHGGERIVISNPGQTKSFL